MKEKREAEAIPFRKISSDLAASKEDINKVYVFSQTVLGEGHFGLVRKASLNYNSDRFYAVKTLKKEGNEDQFHLMKRELEILRSVDHPKIAKFYECYQDEKNFHFVIEYCGGESLVDKIIKDRFIKENKVKRIFHDILSAVNHLHHRGICHRDLKPDNFIFSDKGDKSALKMIDFGLSKNYLTEELNSLVGTPYYVAPELFSKQYDYKCDYWSLGCILYIMLVGKPPFYAKTDELIFQKIAKVDYNFNDERWKSISP